MLRGVLAILVSQTALFHAHIAIAADLSVDGVPLPSDTAVSAAASTTPASHAQYLGAWTGLWDGLLKHLLVVESVAPDGTAKVVYAVGDNPAWRIKQQWMRLSAKMENNKLSVIGNGFTATYAVTRERKLNATFAFANAKGFSQAIMTPADVSDLRQPSIRPSWSQGTSQMLDTDLVEGGKPVRLEVVIYKPQGNGPFPLAVINHGSTGDGKTPSRFRATWSNDVLAETLTERGWIVAFPQRRGRGKSQGLYDEGLEADRVEGYTCDEAASLKGADRALQDLNAAVTVLRRRPDVSKTPILVGGQSRGGALSVAYAGQHPDQVRGVLNFVGGWIGDGCRSATVVNAKLFKKGAPFPQAMLWLYGKGDPFYSLTHSRANFAAFTASGGKGSFVETEVPGGFGHNVIVHFDLWSAPVSDYLQALPK